MIAYTKNTMTFTEQNFKTFLDLHKELTRLEDTLSSTTTDIYTQLKKNDSLYHVSITKDKDYTYINEITKEGDTICE